MSGNIDYQSHVDRMGRPDWWNGETLEDEDGYLTDLIGDHAESFIAEHRDEPFFLYLAHHAPHYPYQGPGDPADRTVGGEFPGVGSVTDRKRAYREMVQSMDDGVGRVLDALEQHGLSENTLVWFFSDNGATREGSNGALRGYKASYWEGGHRVPSIAAMPGRIAPGSTSAALTSTLDVMPTVLAMAGGEAKPDQPFDGIDVGPVLFDGEDTAPRQLFWSSARFEAVIPGPAAQRILLVPEPSGSWRGKQMTDLDLTILELTAPWEWPSDAGEAVLKRLRDNQADETERLLAAELAGEIVIVSQDLTKALTAIVADQGASDELRAQAAISLGPVLEEMDVYEPLGYGLDELDSPPIPEHEFQRIRWELQGVYRAADTPKEVRRRILEA